MNNKQFVSFGILGFVLLAFALFADNYTISYSKIDRTATANLNAVVQAPQLQKNDFELKQNTESKTVSNLDFILKVINLCFVIWAFTVARGDRKVDLNKKDTDEKEKLNRENNLFWFREFVIKPRRDTILEFFNQLHSACHDFCDKQRNSAQTMTVSQENAAIQDAISGINKSIRHFNRNFIQDIIVVDQELGNKINDLIDKIQDDLTGLLSVRTADLNSDAMELLLSEIKKDILRALIGYGKPS